MSAMLAYLGHQNHHPRQQKSVGLLLAVAMLGVEVCILVEKLMKEARQMYSEVMQVLGLEARDSTDPAVQIRQCGSHLSPTHTSETIGELVAMVALAL